MTRDRAAIVELEAQRTAITDLLGSRAVEHAAENIALRIALEAVTKSNDDLKKDVADLQAELSLYKVKP